MKKTGSRAGKRKQPSSEQMARIVTEAAGEMNALEVVALDIKQKVDYTDYLVVCSGRSTKQAQSIADNVQRAMYNAGSKPIGVEGEKEGNWILIDWGSVVVHVFYQPVREFYEIEKIWGGEKSLEL